MASEFDSVSGALLFIIVGTIFLSGGLVTAWAIRPKRPGLEKNTTYESGEDPQGSAWGKFNIRFYIIALLFILFEVEIAFIFPWATVFADPEKISASEGAWAWFAAIEMGLFVFILVLGLVYAWVKGYLDWVRPNPIISTYKSPIPQDAYDTFNKTQDQTHVTGSTVQ